jgi:hypothetical protein
MYSNTECNAIGVPPMHNSASAKPIARVAS